MILFEELSRLSRWLDRWVSRLTLTVAWLALLLLIIVTVFNVVGRQLHTVDWAFLYELQSDLFLGLVMVSFGYAYLRDGHVRIDIFRDRMRARWIAWVEVFGCLAILIPLCGLLIGYGTRSAWVAFVQSERSEAAMGLPYQWVIKSTVPLGSLLLLLASVCVVIRNWLFLMGKEDAPGPKRDDGTAVDSVLAGHRADADPK